MDYIYLVTYKLTTVNKETSIERTEIKSSRNIISIEELDTLLEEQVGQNVKPDDKIEGLSFSYLRMGELTKNNSPSKLRESFPDNLYFPEQG